VNSNDCEQVRIRLMASVDGEAGSASADGRERASADREHLATCSACQAWLENLESLTAKFQGVTYPDSRIDLWPAVKPRISPPAEAPSLVRELWPIGVLALGWRALQLFVDLPMPALHPLVPLAAAAFVVWRAGHRLLAIETLMPELQKRGI
jgi:hypothetical protein